MPPWMCTAFFSQFIAVESGLFVPFVLAGFCSVSEHHLLTANNINHVQLTAPGQQRSTNLTSPQISCDKFSLPGGQSLLPSYE